MSKKATAIVGYLGIIGFVISYFAGDREGAKFDLNQALILGIVELVCGIGSRIIIVGILFSLISLVSLILAIIGIINAAQDVEKPLPIIGGIQLLK